MDIYQNILAELSIEQLAFDENGMCTFSIQRADEEEAVPFTVNIIARPSEMDLVLSVTTSTEIPEVITKSLFLRFGEYALTPMHHSSGIGVYPSTDRLSLFSIISLANNHSKPEVKEVLANLLDEAYQWDAAIANEALSGY